jgi:Flp pilus assembly pilin Flp
MALITATKRFMKRAARFTVDTGASLVEYTLLVALIAAVAIGAVAFLGKGSRDTLCGAAETISGQTAPADANCGAP